MKVHSMPCLVRKGAVALSLFTVAPILLGIHATAVEEDGISTHVADSSWTEIGFEGRELLHQKLQELTRRDSKVDDAHTGGLRGTFSSRYEQQSGSSDSPYAAESFAGLSSDKRESTSDGGGMQRQEHETRWMKREMENTKGMGDESATEDQPEALQQDSVSSHRAVSTIDEALWKSLAEKHAPLVYMHNQENFFPSSVEYFFDRTSERNGHYETNFDWIKCRSNDFMCRVFKQCGADDECNADKNWLLQNGMGGQRPPPDPPIYAIAVPQHHTSGVVDIVYAAFFPYNWGKYGAFPCDMRYGDHVGDWEYIAIRFINEVPSEVYVSHHSRGSATLWGETNGSYRHLRWDAIVELRDGRPVVYSSFGSHGFWGKAGKHKYSEVTIFDYDLTDETSAGTLWDTKNNLQFTVRKEVGSYDGDWAWMNYQGRWGNNEREPHKLPIGVECYDLYQPGPVGPVKRRLLNPNEMTIEFYEQDEYGNFYQDERRCFVNASKSKTFYLTKCNDEANGLILRNVAAGTVITLYQHWWKRGSSYTRIDVKKSTLYYMLGSLEAQYEDNVVKVSSNGRYVNDSVSMVEVKVN